MQQKSAAIILKTLAVMLFAAAVAQAQTFTTLYNFFSGSDGQWPWAGLIQDSEGDLYGTTYAGGANCVLGGCGVVYEISATGAETVLHSFSGSDGQYPMAPVIRDEAGNIYGTTYGGDPEDDGTVFKIDTAGNETVLYNFIGDSDGCSPWQGLVLDKSGNLFGTASYCGSGAGGTIFKVDSAGNFSVLHSFTWNSSRSGAFPEYGHLTMDKSGNLYGVTRAGGANNYGVLYKLSKNGAFTLLHSFAGGTSDGCYPYGSVVQDQAGDFYGTTYSCGSNGEGTIWKVSKTGEEIILHSFAGGASDGCNPFGSVAEDSKSNLYGTTLMCGANNWGALYKLSASGRFTLLHSFSYWTDGGSPYGEVLLTSKGTLFGTATFGGNSGNCSYYGSYDCGTVWKYVP